MANKRGSYPGCIDSVAVQRAAAKTIAQSRAALATRVRIYSPEELAAFAAERGADIARPAQPTPSYVPRSRCDRAFSGGSR